MGRITVVNLTDAPIQSAIANAGSIHSGINGILPHVYYHHNALSGTGYDVMEKWYLPGIVKDFPSSDLSRIWWAIGGALITLLGIATTILSAGSLGPLWTVYGATTATATATATAAGTVAEAAGAAALGGLAAGAAAATPALISSSAALAAFAAAIAGTGLGLGAGAGGLAALIAPPVQEYLAELKERSVGTVWGQSDRILKFTGKLPLEVGQGKDAAGKPTPVLQIPQGMTAETAPPPTFAGDLTWEQFDLMRRNGEIYQIKHRDGEYGDMTQGLVRRNLRAAGGKAKSVSHAGVTVDISKIYKLYLADAQRNGFRSCLMAGEDEGDFRVYLRKYDETQQLSCCYWQFIPTREEGGGWLMVDRRYGRFLYWSHSETDKNDEGEILQYQSEELGKAGIEIDENGWAKKVVAKNENGQVITRDWPKGMVWKLSSHGGPGYSIEQPGNQICVTGRTDEGRAIYARPYGSHDVFQTWVVKAVDDGGGEGVGLSGYVHLQNIGDVPLTNDKFAGTRNEKRRLEGFLIRFTPPIPSLNLEYMAYLEGTGDTQWVKGGEFVGTRGQSRGLEGFAIKLTGEEAAKYRVSYMAHFEDLGDTDFFYDGEFCGTRGQSRRVEGIQVHVERR